MKRMAAKKRSRGQRPRSGSAAPPGTGQADSSAGSPERSAWHRFLVSPWTITVAGGAASALIVAAATGFLGDLFGHHAAPSGLSPIAVNVSMPNPANECMGGRGWVIPAAPSVLAGYPGIEASVRSISRWSAGHKGTPAVDDTITVTVQGRSSSAVVLQDVRIQVLKRRPPIAGIYPYDYPQCGGITTRFLTVNLDSPHPIAKVLRKFSRNGLVSVPFPFKVSNTDPEVFRIERTSLRCDCTWQAILDWIANGRPGHTIINDHGHPFHETAITSATRYVRGLSRPSRWIACIPARKCKFR